MKFRSTLWSPTGACSHLSGACARISRRGAKPARKWVSRTLCNRFISINARVCKLFYITKGGGTFPETYSKFEKFLSNFDYKGKAGESAFQLKSEKKKEKKTWPPIGFGTRAGNSIARCAIMQNPERAWNCCAMRSARLLPTGLEKILDRKAPIESGNYRSEFFFGIFARGKKGANISAR